MLKKRIIPCLDIRDGRTVKGINFENIIDAGDPIELAKRYVIEGADELVFLDITATLEKRKPSPSLLLALRPKSIFRLRLVAASIASKMQRQLLKQERIKLVSIRLQFWTRILFQR